MQVADDELTESDIVCSSTSDNATYTQSILVGDIVIAPDMPQPGEKIKVAKGDRLLSVLGASAFEGDISAVNSLINCRQLKCNVSNSETLTCTNLTIGAEGIIAKKGYEVTLAGQMWAGYAYVDPNTLLIQEKNYTNYKMWVSLIL